MMVKLERKWEVLFLRLVLLISQQRSTMKHQPRKKDEIYFLRNRRSDRGDDDLHAIDHHHFCYVSASFSPSLSTTSGSMRQDINTTKLHLVHRK